MSNQNAKLLETCVEQMQWILLCLQYSNLGKKPGSPFEYVNGTFHQYLKYKVLSPGQMRAIDNVYEKYHINSWRKRNDDIYTVDDLEIIPHVSQCLVEIPGLK